MLLISIYSWFVFKRKNLQSLLAEALILSSCWFSRVHVQFPSPVDSGELILLDLKKLFRNWVTILQWCEAIYVFPAGCLAVNTWVMPSCAMQNHVYIEKIWTGIPVSHTPIWETWMNANRTGFCPPDYTNNHPTSSRMCLWDKVFPLKIIAGTFSVHQNMKPSSWCFSKSMKALLWTLV